MSQTAHTVQMILQMISDLRGESSTNTDTDRIRAISRAEQELARRRFFRMHLVKDQSIGTGDGSTSSFTVGTATYPMRMKGLAEVFAGGSLEINRVPVIDFISYKNTVERNPAANVAYEYYDQANDLWKVKINPAPSNGTAITASWFYMPPTRDDVADTVICENPYIIAYLAVAEVYHGEDELQLEQLSRKEAEDRIAELTSIEEAPAVGQIYQIGSVENSIRGKGIGSY